VQVVNEMAAHVDWAGYLDLGPKADLWSRQALLQPSMPPPFRPRPFRDRYEQSPYWITFVGGRAAIPVKAHNYEMIVRILRESCLDWAAYGGHLLVARALLEMGESVNRPSRAKHIPLHSAVEDGNRQMVELLLSRGADPNYPDIMGRTPLHCAAAYGLHEIASLLLCAGADPYIADDQGDNALEIAKQSKYWELATLFGKVISEHQAQALRLLTGPVLATISDESNERGLRRL
jgi:hypothetical protein